MASRFVNLNNYLGIADSFDPARDQTHYAIIVDQDGHCFNEWMVNDFEVGETRIDNIPVMISPRVTPYTIHTMLSSSWFFGNLILRRTRMMLADRPGMAFIREFYLETQLRPFYQMTRRTRSTPTYFPPKRGRNSSGNKPSTPKSKKAKKTEKQKPVDHSQPTLAADLSLVRPSPRPPTAAEAMIQRRWTEIQSR